ncbi:30S ribosomal protein S8e [Candidatus Woesearchaeota archaeon]|jgi:small subunit ribosomal protein S8e|nr:30S ribosomal protein S8e [Candidatus Woesearchaeota archaeon]
MGISHHRSKKQTSGGVYKRYRKQRQFELGTTPSLTKLGEKKFIDKRTLGNNTKRSLLQCEEASVTNSKTGKTVKTTIKTILESPANRHYTRRNIMTKGTIIDTELGKARVTSRPGQEGAINAVLVE